MQAVTDCIGNVFGHGSYRESSVKSEAEATQLRKL